MQAAHAAFEAGAAFSRLTAEHPHFCICSVRDEKRLLHDLNKLKQLGIQIVEWREPDRNNELTAFACAPVSGDDRKHFRNFQLMRMEAAPEKEVA